MVRFSSLTLVFLFLISQILACGKGNLKPEPTLPIEGCNLEIDFVGDVGDGFHQIDVPMPDGEVEQIWIAITGDPNQVGLPAVVHGRGQGPSNVTNCDPNDKPYIPTDELFALRDRGFLAVGIAYRDAGSTAPNPLEAWRPRDSYYRDALALLYAGHWASVHHTSGGDPHRRIVPLGQSVGTLPALWSVSVLPELQEIQNCMRLEAAIVAGEASNQVSAAHQPIEAIEEGKPIEAVLGAIFGSTRIHIADRDLNYVTPGMFADPLDPWNVQVQTSLRVLGLIASRAIFLDEADTSIPECAELEGLPPACELDTNPPESSCNYKTLEKIFADADPSLKATTNLTDLENYMTTEGLAALNYWDPDSGDLDPGGATGNQQLDAAWRLSPVYNSPGYVTKHVLSLLAENDSHFEQEKWDLLKNALQSQGVEVSAPTITAPECKHTYYVDPDLPHCGLDQITDFLDEVLDL